MLHSGLKLPSITWVLVIMMSLGCSDDEGGSSGSTAEKPEVGFSYHINGYVAPSRMTFTNNSKHATSYQWDFGDGTTSTLKDPVHEYHVAGTYTIKLIAFNSNASNTTGVTITIQPAYSSCRLQKLILNDAPFLRPNGMPWDPSSDPDFKIKILFRNTSQVLATTNTIGEVTAAQLPLTYDFSPAWLFPAFNQEYDVLLYDDDTPDPDELVDGYFFKLSDATTINYHYPDTMWLYQTGSALRMSLILNWGY